MVDIRIKSLKNTSFDELFEAFRQAFAEYEVQLDRAELQAMLKRRGFDPELSFAAFDGDITPFVPEEVSKRVYEKYKQS